MKSKQKNIAYLIISLLMALLLNNMLIFNNGVQTELSIPKQSAGYIESFILVDGTATGIGAHNWTWAESQLWCSGDGSWSTPYVIEKVSINAISSPTGSGILINNSLDVYFIIKNCTIINAQGATGDYGAGIELQNCSRGLIFNNTITDSGTYACGILLEGYNCYNITIERNVVRSIGRHGILTYGGNEIFIIHNNVTYSSYQGIYLYMGSYNATIENNNANNNGQYGIYLNNGCHNNTIIGNNASENNDGIYLYSSDNNTIQGNIANDNADEGIDLNRNCDYNRVIGNIANNNPSEGIQLYSGSDFNIISGNNVSNNDNGIRLNSACRNNTILNNNASYNKNRGIYLNTGSNDNNITENIVNNNLQSGIYLPSSDYNNIINNTINDNNEHGIYLPSSDYSNIKNNSINRNDLGIGLYYSDYNNVSGNTLKDNSWCIYETDSTGNIIEYNDCSPPTMQEPIFIDGLDTGVGAHNWTWAESQSWCSGSGTWNDPYIIENLIINGFGIWHGIYIYNSNVSFIIQDCLIVNSNTGIYLENVNNSRLINNNCSNINWGILLESSNNNTISGNTANGNIYEGIYLTESMGNTLSGNTANDNGDSGIHLDTECMGNTLSGNTVNDNNYGIFIEEDCYNNTISGNTANDNNYGISLEYYCINNNISGNIANSNSYGIYIYDYSSNNTISGNTANDNDDTGIYLEYYCINNNISGNIANSNNFYGILLYDCVSNNTISGNTANDNNYGIYLEYECINNNISGNIANDNDDTGIYLESECDYNDIIDNIFYNNTLGIFIDSNCDNNSIYQNFFLENGKHAEDDGTDNKWNSTSIGNYWDNWTSPDVSPNDGIVDVPYTYIGGSAGSIDYLPIAEDGAPVIVINSPDPGDVFGATAPSFDVTITDVYLVSMWYTLDGGLHNYTFTENGVINQTAWAALPEGSVTITFYASDIVGNEAIKHVVVTKSLTDDVGPVIITIIVVSIVSGVALIGVGYIYFKKRKNRISE
ncbi:MAG: right-handed parallel beta-helix repeat-containing protein [Candidatus Lokiarchaeota archaeon]|nr:right-handed parallel beta-helix repeat-containing protein [Candidatus Lokiarchaeota archaeon]